MSGSTLTVFEELYSCGDAATTTSPSTSAVSLIAGWPSIEIPGRYFTKKGALASSARMLLRGLLTTTATIPTWTFGVAFTQALPATFPTPATANILVATATRTPGTAATNAVLSIDLDIALRVSGAAGANSQLVSSGFVECESLAPAAYSATVTDRWSMPATNVSMLSGGAANIDPDQPVFIWPYLTLGAATAGNTVALQFGKLYGEN